MGRYLNHRPVMPLTLMVGATRLVCKGATVLSEAQVDIRPDVDDTEGPLVVVQVTSSAPLENGPFGAAVQCSVRWYVTHPDAHTAETMAVDLMEGMNRLWRDGTPLNGGMISHLEMGYPFLGGLQFNTSDYNEFNVTATVVVRSTVRQEG